MKHKKIMLRMLSVLTICAFLIVPAGAADFQEHTSSDAVLEIIIRNEGFLAYPMTDSSGTYIGHGSLYSDAVALFGEDCEPITEEQAAELTRYQLDAIDAALNSFLRSNNIQVGQNQFDALADFTYGVGIGWTVYKNTDGSWCKLKALLLEGSAAWTEDRVREAFGTWVYAGGVKLDGLVRRRGEEATLFLTPDPDPSETPSEPPSEDPASAFSDVRPGDWYYEPIQKVSELGIMNGSGNGIFAPNGTLTRAQLVVTLANFDGADLSLYSTSAFLDVPENTWYTAAVAWAADMGYVDGYGDGTFRPTENVTREQICCILARYLRREGATSAAPSLSFTDEAAISGYAQEDVGFCSSLGLVTGMGDGSFAPKAGATRAQTAVIFVRMTEIG